MLKDKDYQNYCQQYRDYLSQFCPISDEDWLFYCEKIEILKLTKGQYFLEAGSLANTFGFVVSGLFKQYFYTIKGQVYINGFVNEGRMLSDFSSLIQFKPAKTNLVALEDSVVLVQRKEKNRKSMAFNPTWERIGRCLAEIRFVEKWDREWSFLCEDATQRYSSFCEQNPHLLSRLTQGDIASYLGISSVSLSRIANKVREQRDC